MRAKYEEKKNACLENLITLIRRRMLNDVALFDRIYIRALIIIFFFSSVSTRKFLDHNGGRCVTNSFRQKSGRGGKKTNKTQKFSPILSRLLSFSRLLSQQGEEGKNKNG